MATQRFGRRRWRRPERMLLDHAPVARRKDLGVSEPIGVEPELGRRASRRQLEVLLVTFAVAVCMEGFLVGLLAGYPLLGTIAFAAIGVAYFFVARRFGDTWLLRAVRATGEPGPRASRLARSEARTAGIPPPRVVAAPGDTPNAVSFALRRRSIVTTAGTESLDELALEGMLAHEVIHLRDGDATVASLYAVLAGGPDLLLRGGGALSALSLPLLPAVLVLRLLRGVVATSDREHRADIAAAMMTRYPPGIAEALRSAGGGSCGVALLDGFWFVARNDGATGERERRAGLVAEM